MWSKVRTFWRHHKKGTVAAVLIAAGMPAGLALKTGDAVDQHTHATPVVAPVKTV